MSPYIVLWALRDRQICGDENGRLLVIKNGSKRTSERSGSNSLKCVRCSVASYECAVLVPGRGVIHVPMQNALIDGYLVRCNWIPEIRTWVVAGDPTPLPSMSN